MRESIATAQIQKNPASRDGEMNAPFSEGVQTPTEIEELRLRTSPPVKKPE